MKIKPGEWDFKGFFERPKEDEPLCSGWMKYYKTPNSQSHAPKPRFSEPPTREEIVAMYPALGINKIIIIPEKNQEFATDLRMRIEAPDKQCGISIVRVKINKEGGRPYEVCPIFDSKRLIDLGLGNDGIIGGLSLESALDIAAATMSRDKRKLEEVIRQYT